MCIRDRCAASLSNGTGLGRAGREDDHEGQLNLSLIHISEPTRLRRSSYAVFCLKKINLAAGIHLEHAPPALRKAADEHNLPLFEVAYEVPFRTITSYIITSLVSSDMHLLRRSLSVQNHLLSLLVEEKGADHLVSSLSMLLNVTVILFDGRGAVLSQAQHRVHVDSEQGNMIWQTYQEVAAAGEIPKEVNWGELHLA